MRHRDDPLVRALAKLAALFVAAVVVLWLAFSVVTDWWFSENSGAEIPRRVTKDSDLAGSAVSPYPRNAIERTLRQGVESAADLGGAVEAAVMFDTWTHPVVVASPADGANDRSRMWSMSKVPTITAVLRSLEWGDKPGERLPQEVVRASEAAIVRSENCRQRRVVLALQNLNGGSPDGAIAAMGEVMKQAGSEASISTEVEAPDAICIDYLSTQTATPDAFASAALFGVSEQTAADAARFMNALGSGVYGDATARRVLGLMRQPKQPSRETPREDYTAESDWGAGKVFDGMKPAYKAGWGGTQHGNFMAGQIVFLELPDRHSISIAVMFHPFLQPTKDDPGLTNAPQGIERVLRSVEDLLESSAKGR